MALRFTESCDPYSANADLDLKWIRSNTSNVTFNATGGNYGAGAIQMSAADNAQTRKLWPTFSAANLCVGFWFKASGLPTSQSTMLACFNGASSGASLYVTTAGILHYNSGDGLDLTGGQVCDGAYHWIEVKFWNNVANGTHAFYLDNVLQGSHGSFSGTPYAGTNRLYFGGMAGRTTNYDDIIAWDNAGSGLIVADLPLGPQRLRLVKPNGVGTTTQFTPTGAANNYDCVDDSPVNDGDTTYVASATNAQRDLYTFEDLSGVTTIKGAMLNVVAKNPGGGALGLKNVTKSGGTTSAGISLVPFQTYECHMYPVELDPNTSAEWTQTNFNAAEFGYEIG